MKYHELKTLPKKQPKRVGRGIAAGQGKTAGRGTKGQKARTGASQRPGFAGGSNPLMQQLPKLPGFKSHKEKTYEVFTGQIETMKGATVTATQLAAAGFLPNAYVKVKLIVKGDLTRKVSVKLPAASQTAVDVIEKAGGSFEKTVRLSRVTLEKNRKTDKVA